MPSERIHHSFVHGNHFDCNYPTMEYTEINKNVWYKTIDLQCDVSKLVRLSARWPRSISASHRKKSRWNRNVSIKLRSTLLGNERSPRHACHRFACGNSTFIRHRINHTRISKKSQLLIDNASTFGRVEFRDACYPLGSVERQLGIFDGRCLANSFDAIAIRLIFNWLMRATPNLANGARNSMAGARIQNRSEMIWPLRSSESLMTHSSICSSAAAAASFTCNDPSYNRECYILRAFKLKSKTK